MKGRKEGKATHVHQQYAVAPLALSTAVAEGEGVRESCVGILILVVGDSGLCQPTRRRRRIEKKKEEDEKKDGERDESVSMR